MLIQRVCNSYSVPKNIQPQHIGVKQTPVDVHLVHLFAFDVGVGIGIQQRNNGVEILPICRCEQRGLVILFQSSRDMS